MTSPLTWVQPGLGLHKTEEGGNRGVAPPPVITPARPHEMTLCKGVYEEPPF